MRCAVPTDLMSQHALQPLLSGSGDVDGQCGSAVHHCHRGSGQEVICHLDYYLSTNNKRTTESEESRNLVPHNLFYFWWKRILKEASAKCGPMSLT